MTSFRLLLASQEEQMLDALKKTYPTTTKASNVVELCSKIIDSLSDDQSADCQDFRYGDLVDFEALSAHFKGGQIVIRTLRMSLKR